MQDDPILLSSEIPEFFYIPSSGMCETVYRNIGCFYNELG